MSPGWGTFMTTQHMYEGGQAGASPFCRGYTSAVSPKTGMGKFPEHEHFRALGFAGQRRVRSDEDGC